MIHVLASYAFPYWIGAVFSHVMGWFREAYCICGHEHYPLLRSDTHSLTKKHCPLYLVSPMKFNSYFFGNVSLFFQTTGLSCICWGNMKLLAPIMASARIHRWAVTLSAYQCTIHYKPGSEMCNANGLNRLPSASDLSPEEFLPNNLIGLIDLISTTPILADLVSKHTRCDSVLSLVCCSVKKWVVW